MTPERFDTIVAATRAGSTAGFSGASAVSSERGGLLAAQRRRPAGRVFVPRDSSALSVGADDVAQTIGARLPSGVSLVRNGSRGLYWLEPLVEVETAEGRIAYGPVTAGDVESLLAADFLSGGTHPLRVGPTEQIPYLVSAGTPHVRARRHHRSRQSGRLHRIRRLGGTEPCAGDDA